MIAKQFLNHPFTMIISGSTGSGKTVWLMNFLRNLKALIQGGKSAISEILYCYGEINENIIKLQGIKILNGIKFSTLSGTPSEEMIQQRAIEEKGRLLLILDDLVMNIKVNLLDSLFTKGSHNWGVSVVLVTQHLFLKELKTARNNSHYLVLMRNPAGELQIRNLAQQLFPLRTRFFLEAYKNATLEKYSYLFIDMHPNTEENMRLKTNIYPDELTIVYVEKY